MERRSVGRALAVGATATVGVLVGLFVARTRAASRAQSVTFVDRPALSATGRAEVVQALAALRSSPPSLPPH